MSSKPLFDVVGDRPRLETKVAAAWWAQQVEAFRSQKITSQDIKADPNLALLEVAQRHVTPAKVKTFRELLEKAIDKKLNNLRGGFKLGVNMLPDLLLLGAMDWAGFGPASIVVLQSYSYTIIKPGEVIAAHGSVDKPGKEVVLPLT